MLVLGLVEAAANEEVVDGIDAPNASPLLLQQAVAGTVGMALPAVPPTAGGCAGALSHPRKAENWAWFHGG